MATKTATKSTDAAGRRTKAAAEAPLARYAETEPTAVHKEFADWIEEQTGIKPDLKSIQLGAVLRPLHQKSESNQTRIANAKQAKLDQEAAREQARADRLAKREAREAAAAAKAAEPKPEKAVKEPKAPKTPAAKAAPAAKAPKAAAKPAAKTTAAKPAATGKTRRRSSAASDTDAF
jgi:hypothetical protein